MACAKSMSVIAPEMSNLVVLLPIANSLEFPDTGRKLMTQNVIFHSTIVAYLSFHHHTFFVGYVVPLSILDRQQVEHPTIICTIFCT